MRIHPISLVGAFLLAVFCNNVKAQSFGTVASAVWISDCSQSNFFNTSGAAVDAIGPATNTFNNTDLGVYTQNSGSLVLRGAQIKSFKNPASSNVCSARMFYRVYQQAATPGVFNSIDLPFLEDCNGPAGVYPSGGPCTTGDQKWQRIILDGTTTPYAPVNLTAVGAGKYFLEVYYELSGSQTSTTLCNDIVTLNNGGANYKASFTIQAPTLSSTNPSTCNGTEGSITISGLAANATYQLTYTDDGATVGPLTVTSNAGGQVTVSGLNAGLYANFTVDINGCTTSLFTGVILSNPIFVPTFTAFASFCAGTTPPTLPPVSNNGVSGTWSPAVINNSATGTYTFTPAANQCGIPVTITVTVIPRTVPTFSFGTSLNICNGGTVPTLTNASLNGVTGTWSPTIVSNTATATYTFTPTAGLCASPTTFTVTVNPNITPTFEFGTALTICAGNAVPALPTSSTEAITGTWSPATVSNTAGGVYTFTPTAGQCALPATFTVTVNPNIVPTFTFGTSLNVCSGGSVPTLTSPSIENITGTWSPATVSNTASGTYTFTPTAGQCALTATFTVTVNPNIIPSFPFGTGVTICAGGAVPTLTNTSTNGITGSWTPATIDNQNSGIYTFTPDAGQCALPATFAVTVNPNITPAFTFGTTLVICSGGTVPVLTTTSTNGITGTWSPATVSNTAGGVYIFTPTAGQCALPATFTVTVNPNIVPTFAFGTSLNVCSGGSVPTLTSPSIEGITGTWSPATVSNTANGTYTFTPTAGQCALPATFTVTVNPNITPDFPFGTALSICEGGSVPVLTTTSTNGITGTWNPAIIDNTASGTYTFTPDAGQCAVATTFTLTANPNIIPAFNLGANINLCTGATSPELPTMSVNGIDGTWSPATVDNQSSGTYTFTPGPGQCATTTSIHVTVNPNITPVFSFGTTLTICSGGTVPALPTSSTNGINGTWSPATVSNTASGVYTFTPGAGQCATPTTFTVTITPNAIPAFAFGTSLTICDGGTVPLLETTSTNGVTGTWSPAVVDNHNSAVYTFTPTTGQCALPATFTVTVNPNLTPVFDFGTTLTICANGNVPTLPTTSANGVTGSWSPATIDNQNSGIYTFTPTTGQCVLPATVTFTVTVTTNLVPTFSFGHTLTICAGGNVPVLPTMSDNGIAGTWTPAVVSDQTTGTYVFSAPTGDCVLPYTYTVTVNPIVTPTFAFGTSLSTCIGSVVPVLPNTSSNGVTGTWSPSTVDNQADAVYTFTPSPGQCAIGATFTLAVDAIPTGTIRTDTTVYDGAVVPSFDFQQTGGSVVNWTNSNPAIGLAASGTGTVPSFTAINLGTTPITATITVTPVINGCTGATQTYVITVLPLDKDVFIPNVFSPNGDGKNDILFVYGNYITKLDMHIFNQWGQEIAVIRDKTQGWDGRHKGTYQPVGVYVYVMKATLADGRTIDKKGSITLVR